MRATTSLLSWLLATGAAGSMGAQVRGRPTTTGFDVPVGSDKVQHDMAGRVPGFAGFLFEGDTLVALVVDTATHGAAAREMVAEYVERSRGRRPAVVVARAARYDFRQLFGWKAVMTMSPPAVGMTEIGVCEDRDQVCIGIRPGRSVEDVLAKADRLGIPRAAVHAFHADVIRPRGPM